MWYARFPPPGRCSPASSSLGRAFPRSPQRRKKMLRCCHSNVQLQHKKGLDWPHSNCVQIKQWGPLCVPKGADKAERSDIYILCWACSVARLGYLGFIWKAAGKTHPRVCKSTPLCRFLDRHTPACSQLCHEVSSKCPQFCKTFHFHGSGLQTTSAKRSLLTEYAVSHLKAISISICNLSSSTQISYLQWCS